MKRFVVLGGKRLEGCIEVGGSKNAVLPILFATVLTNGISVIKNVPDIKDVRVTLDILRELGAVAELKADTVTVDTRDLHYNLPSEHLVRSIRASSYLLGALTARFGRAKIMNFGGCNFDNRPIDMHLSAMRRVGVRIEEADCYLDAPTPADITFDKVSVGATVNALLLTAAVNGRSRIFGYAREPHVFSLIDYLNSAGARITFTPDYISVEGGRLCGAEITAPPDMIEAGSYIIASLATRSAITVRGARREHLSSLFDLLSLAGAGFSFDGEAVTPFGEVVEWVNLFTSPHPGFPTDLQPLTAPLFALSAGGRITEGVWQGRFGYLRELGRFGLCYRTEPSSAEIFPSVLTPATATAPDLRGGAALLVAALAAKGESVIYGSDVIGRGYADIANKLRGVGAVIEEL